MQVFITGEMEIYDEWFLPEELVQLVCFGEIKY